MHPVMQDREMASLAESVFEFSIMVGYLTVNVHKREKDIHMRDIIHESSAQEMHVARFHSDYIHKNTQELYFTLPV